MELLNGETWEVIELSQSQSSWNLNQNGHVGQASITGDKKRATGTILIKEYCENVDSILVGLYPGSKNISGMVFNYVDSRNFYLFLIDRKSLRFFGYEIVFAEVKNGDYYRLSSEKYFNSIPVKNTLDIKVVGGNIELFYNHKLFYTWPGEIKNNTGCGFYSQLNDDAEFISLNISRRQEFQVGINSGKPATPVVEKSTGLRNDGDGDLVMEDTDKFIKAFVKMDRPRAQTVIRIDESFRVSLDSFYENILFNIDTNSSIHKVASGATWSSWIDYRPKRWYQEYQRIVEAIGFVESDIARAHNALVEIEKNNSDVITTESYAEHEVRIKEQRRKYFQEKDKLQALKNQENNLLNEIKAASYSLYKLDGETQFEGYNFYIEGVTKGISDFAPIDIPEGLDFDDDVQWNELEIHLRDNIFQYNEFPAMARLQYMEMVDELASLESSNFMQEVLAKNKKDIEHLNEKISEYQFYKGQFTRQALDLQGDIDLLRQAIECYESLNLKLYPEKIIVENNMISGVFPPDTVLGRLANDPVWSINKMIARSESPENAEWVKFENTPYVSNDVVYRLNETLKLFPLVAINKFQIGLRYYRHLKMLRFVFGMLHSDDYLGWHVMPPENLMPPGGQSQLLMGPAYIARAEGVQMIPTALHFTVDDSKKPVVSKVIAYVNSVNVTGGTVELGLSWNVEGCTSIMDFFSLALQKCKEQLPTLNAKIESVNTEINKLLGDKNRLEDASSNTKSMFRKQFVQHVNRPDTIDKYIVNKYRVNPNTDPLQDFIEKLSEYVQDESIERKISVFDFVSDGFYDQEGRSLRAYVDNIGNLPHGAVAIVPVFADDGQLSNEIMNAVINPTASTRPAEVPKITFVETYHMEIGWKGYCLGELSHTVNLFPGEVKQLVVEKRTSLSKRIEKKEGVEATESAKQSDSFEDRLQDEFSEGGKSEQESSSQLTNDRKTDITNAITASSSSTTSASLTASLGYSGFGVTANVSGAYSASRTRNENRSKSQALSASQNQKKQKSNKDTKEILKKQVANSVKKVASETSRDNKVSFSSISTENIETSTQEKETISLENPNIGRTVNYNFFQLQNMYGTSMHLVDVKIIVDSGKELIERSGMSDVKIYDLEEFGKIYADCEHSEAQAHEVFAAAVVARQVMKHYADFCPGVTSGNGVLKLHDSEPAFDKSMAEILAFSSDCGHHAVSGDELVNELKVALDYLKSKVFKFDDSIDFIKQIETTVNTGSYYLESEVGLIPSTEKYLEERRDIETDRQRAINEELRAKIAAGVFYQELPDGLSNLTICDDEKFKQQPG